MLCGSAFTSGSLFCGRGFSPDSRPQGRHNEPWPWQSEIFGRCAAVSGLKAFMPFGYSHRVPVSAVGSGLPL